MRIILFIIQKEFLQIFRNKGMLPIIFAVPIIQMIILVNAATFEMKNIDILFVDNDLSTTSKEIIEKFIGSDFFNVIGKSFSIEEAYKKIEKNEAEVFLHFPNGFERKLIREGVVDLDVEVDAVNGRAAGLITGYVSMIIKNYNQSLMIGKLVPNIKPWKIPEQINIETSYWYNPKLNYKTFMVPGILVILVTIIGIFLSGMNVVREKEIGTIEQLNVTPINKYQFIIGKLVPFLIIGLFEFAFGLVIGKLLFDIPIEGSIPLVFLCVTAFLISVLGIGLFISTMNDTQQQAMLVSYFFMMVFILMSGLFTPTESMPNWALVLNKFNPIFYFLKINRMILLKGSGFLDISKEFFSLIGLGFVMLNLAVMRYKKTL